ncbi:MAG TPA: hypothetical protein EYP71_01705 [Dehalococcoidia bacterium]|nr:hypothetical protein [Dehalococcoidia bacterium]
MSHIEIKSSLRGIPILVVMLSVLLSAIACRPQPPAILVFIATPDEITIGQSVTLRWSIKDATSVDIDQGIGDVPATGSVVLSPTRTLAYTLTATNAGGTVSKSVVIYVNPQPPPPPDTRPPLISSVVASFESDTKVVITWTTNELSIGQVEYGESTDYGSVVTSGSEFGTVHRVTLDGLESNTVYHYRVKVRDKAGNEAVSADYALITPAPKSPYVLVLEWVEWGRRTEGGVVPGFGITVAENTYLFIKGSVRNNSRATLRGVICTMNCWSGDTLTKSEVYVHHSPVLPGQVFDFNMETADDPSVDKVTIEFADSSGYEIQLINP